MKANELMIGDYVKFLGKVRKIKSIVRKDTGIEISFEGKNPVIVSLDDIEPIPLTSEILEKNEWKCSNTYHKYCHPKAPFAVWQKKDGGYTIEVDGDEYGSAEFLFILHVHQLQNAIRLCGIEKEIVL